MKMKKKSGLDLRVHKLTGKMLYGARQYLLTLSSQLASAYGKSDGATRQATRALAAVDGLRSKLDSRVSREQADLTDLDAAKIYYPGEAT